MRLHRFYTTEKLSAELTYKNPDHIHQWKNVFRYGANDSIILFGDGFEHTYKIVSIDKKQTVLLEISSEPSKIRTRNIRLGIALIKKENFELVLEKCTEIGVSEFVPLITDRSLQKIYNVERLQKILIESAEQSGWGSVPRLQNPINFKKLLEFGGCTILHMDGKPLASKNLQNNIICIGPEGGWSTEELEEIKNRNIDMAALQTGVLRSETAAIVISGLAFM